MHCGNRKQLDKIIDIKVINVANFQFDEQAI